MNFGETLVYWYLRLNGFFLLSNFVLHRAQGAVEYSADADLLAIRLPNVYEVVGGRESDWDTTRFLYWGLALEGETIGLIVEVKTGRNIAQMRGGVCRAFSEDRLLYGICRLGIWHRDQAQGIVEQLRNEPIYRDPDGQGVAAKLLVTNYIPQEDQIPPCLVLPLQEADDFVVRRMVNYIDQKAADRMFFPSDLVQYIIWKCPHQA